MDEKFRKALEEDGWRIGTVQEFLGLTDAEMACIEIHHQLAETFGARRAESGLTQAKLAKRMGSSQSRVAKMEKGDPSVSLDLLIKGLLAIGVTRQEIGAIIASAEPPQPMNRPDAAPEESAAAD